MGGSGLKSRSGCQTCKARRVKCDETKPKCLRCRDMHRECGGYIAKDANLTHSGRRTLQILPKVLAPSAAPPPLIRLREPRQNMLSSEQECRYFKVFCDTTVLNLAEYLDHPLWNPIILQATEHSMSIKHAATALGALTLANSPNTKDPVHYEFALQQYGKSIKSIREACADERQDTRTILINCLLAICFECFFGSIDSAVAQIRVGIKLLNEWLWSRIHHISFVDQQLIPGVIEDELLCVFLRLEDDVFSLYEAEQIKIHPDLQAMSWMALQHMPVDGFQDLQTARLRLDILLRQIERFMYSIDAQRWTAAEKTSESIPLIEVNDPPFGHVPNLGKQESLEAYKKMMVRWYTAFQPLYKRSLAQGQDNLLVATALLLRFTCDSISINCCFKPEIFYDTFIHDFKVALSLAETLCKAGCESLTMRPTFITSSILIRS